MARQLILSDASPLIALSLVGGLPWLKSLFGTVTLTSIVYQEIVPGAGKPGETDIQAALEKRILKVIDDKWSDPQFPELDEGEASTLRAAVNLRQPCLILMDEKIGRTVAREHGLAVTGVAGIILIAKQRHLIPSATRVFEQLLQKGFRVSPQLIRAVLDEAGESLSG